VPGRFHRAHRPSSGRRRLVASPPAEHGSGDPAARVIRDRLTAALGPDIDPDVIDSLEMLYSGALVRAGMGYASNTEIAQRLEKSARLILS
jgi:hypothetical protein